MTEFERCLYHGRKARKLSQGEVAEKAGLTREDIISLESGRFISLDDDTIYKIAAVVDMESGMFLSMYRAAFQQELRKAHSGPPIRNGAADTSQVESVHQESALSPDLLVLGKAIMAMPSDVKENLVETIRMLVRTVSISTA